MALLNEYTDASLKNNKLDLLLFEELLTASKIMQQIQTQGSYLMEGFQLFMLDLFLMLYKKVVIIEEMPSINLSALLIQTLFELPQVRKVRNRTAGSKYETYIAYKFFMDGLFEKIRGSQNLKELQDLIESLKEMELLEKGDLPDQPFNKATEIAIDELQLTSDEASFIKAIHQILQESDDVHSDPMDTFRQLIRTSLEQAEHNETSFDECDLDNAITQSYKVLKEHCEEHEMPPEASAYLERILFELSDSLKQEDTNAFLEDQGPEASANDSTGAPVKGTFDTAFKEMIMDLEKRTETEASLRILREGTFKGTGQHWNTPASDASPIEAYQIEDGKPSDQDAPHSEEILRKGSVSKGQGFLDELPESFDNGEKTAPASIYELVSALTQPKTVQVQLQHSIERVLDELHLERIFNDTITKLDRFNQHIEILNIAKQQMQTRSFDDVMAFFKRLEDPLMIKFLNKVGRKRSSAEKAQYQKHRAKDIPTDRIVLSDDLNNLVDDELIPLALDIEAFENDFIDRFLHQNIQTLDQISKTAKHKGPIILCYDGSGSMEGDKIQETKAHIIAFIEIARIQKRKLIAIQFASANEPLYIQEINPKRVTVETISGLLDTFIRGGTDFEKPLQKAMEYIMTDRYKHADILFITDGVCDISESFKQMVLRTKAEKEFKLYTLIIHGNTYEDFRDIGQISDEVMEIKQRDLSDWNTKMSERIFSI